MSAQSPGMGAQRLASCVYRGTLVHRRFTPDREFRHTVAMAYVDLAELPNLLGGRLLRPAARLTRFSRSDYHGDRDVELSEAVRDTVEGELGMRPEGPVRLLTNLRSLGICFNPVSFYYCFDRSGERLQAVLMEVTNTPWGERQSYVVEGGSGRLRKRMHVSPFMPMDQSYVVRAGLPADRLSVTIQNRRSGRHEFAASLQMRRVELTGASLRRAALAPPPALRTLALIYGHGLALRVSGVRAYPHPRRRAL